jgi:ORF6N domain
LPGVFFCKEQNRIAVESLAQDRYLKNNMTKTKMKTVIVVEKVVPKIVMLRKERVILDVHLAELYGVETRVLKQAVRRNSDRFPKDFMFELTRKEVDSVVSQNVIPHKKYLGGASPFAFTETGVAMLSGVLKSPGAIEMNIVIMRAFIALRKIASNYKEIMQILTEMRNQYDSRFAELYTTLEQLINPPGKPRQRIGYRRSNEQD